MQVGAMRDMAEARRRMVDGQLRPNRITDARLIAAMGDIPRERFVPAVHAARAYADEDVPLPGGRGVIQPMVIARLLQLLAIRDGDRVLVVGAGTGYAATVAARCGARVVALEEDPALIEIARRASAGLVDAAALRFVQGPLRSGFPAAAPHDAILIEGEAAEIPPELPSQLAEGGRLVAVLAGATPGRGPRAVIGRRAGGGFSLMDAFDCSAPRLPALAAQPGFVL